MILLLLFRQLMGMLNDLLPAWISVELPKRPTEKADRMCFSNNYGSRLTVHLEPRLIGGRVAVGGRKNESLLQAFTGGQGSSRGLFRQTGLIV